MHQRFVLYLGLLSHQRYRVNCFSSLPIKCTVRHLCASLPERNDRETPDARHALLISSYADGMLGCKEAQTFFRDALLRSIYAKEITRLEGELRESVLVSPCNGPDPGTLKALERADQLLGEPSLILDYIERSVVRFVYIPTALYAIRADSNNSPGRQRQRARADGRKRRQQITDHVSSLLGESVSIQAVTLDLDDGSVKQPQGTPTFTGFPLSGKEALGEWKPHLVYIEGGNTFWLYHCVEKGGWQESIRNAVTGGDDAAVYCGKSAGAIIAGAQMETATWKEWDDPSVVPGKETYAEWKGISGLNLINGLSIFPHMDDQWIETVTQKQGSMASPVTCLRDSDICLFDGRTGRTSVVSTNDSASLRSNSSPTSDVQ